MITIEPAYDPKDNVWYLEDGTHAPTLRALIDMMGGPSFVFVPGYYPKGYGSVIRVEEQPSIPQHVLDAVNRRASWKESPERKAELKKIAEDDVPFKRQPNNPRGYTDDEVQALKKMKREGATCRQIGTVLKRSRNSIISKMHQLKTKGEL